MFAVSFLRRPAILIVVAVCVIAGSFALYTNHVWEDFYITYRSSKHLATGDGLVHNVGQRLHTFTSPLGVLLPALSSLLTLNSSDTAALWIFRGMAIAALGAAGVLIYASTRRLGFPLIASVFFAMCLATDAKTVDFTINGMETPFVIAFFGYALWSMYAVVPRRWLHLGLAWGGLMWSRPDGCVTIALLTVAVWLFNDVNRTGVSRREWIPILLRAAGVATVVYLPWFAFAWFYYGTPVPHTIVAKAALAGPKNLLGFWNSLLAFGAYINSPYGSIDGIFSPAQMLFGGWPEMPRIAARAVAAICAVLWLVGALRREIRALSFTYFGLCLYLNYFPPFPSSWYLSLPTAIALVVLAGTIGQLYTVAGRVSGRFRPHVFRALVILPAALFFVQGCWFTLQAARQLKAQQAIIETGLRRPIGEWLRQHSGPGDTVFMEPLGYIGFFSGLKTYDYPGLSSPEMVSAIRRYGKTFPSLIRDLKPTWLVLRGSETDDINDEDPFLLRGAYERVQMFDRRKDVEELTVQGLDYIRYDAVFIVYRRRI